MTTAHATPQAAGTGARALDGRVALVTGGTRGIGAAISRSLGAAGAVVAAGYTRDDDAAQRFIKDFCSTEDNHGSVHRGNVGNTDDCERVVQEVIDRHGRLDILVNNAGITSDKTVLKMSNEDWQKVLDVNLSGAFYLSKAALQHMLERGTGRIINISSIIGQTGNIGQANYAASKSGLFGLTMTLAKEAAFALGKAGKLEGNDVAITVNAITPGFIATDMLATVPEKVLDGIRAQVPLRRLGKPDEVARAAYFLAGDESGYINGAVIAVNGGMDM
jgi:NAD(P)-dependent dehydrogenase (short-subunit alcohol dehydrogenase family)